MVQKRKTKLVILVGERLESSVSLHNFICSVVVDAEDSFDSMSLGSFKSKEMFRGEVHRGETIT